jgi:hypothetical protein
MPFGGLLGGFLSDGFGIVAALLVVGFAYFAATMLPLAIPAFRSFDKPRVDASDSKGRVAENAL